MEKLKQSKDSLLCVFTLLATYFRLQGIFSEKYLSFQENLVCDQLALEIQFISISNKFINDLNNILEDYQIKITKYLDGKYVKKIFDNKMEPCEMFHRTIMGYNKNEVIFVPKNIKKSGFFESFFQLFS